MKKIFSSLLVAATMFLMIPLNSSATLVPGGGEPDPATVKAAFAEFKNLSKKEKKRKNKRCKKRTESF